MSFVPTFATTPRTVIRNISVANPNRDGTGVMYDIISAGSGGTRIDCIAIKAVGSTTAGMIRLYLATSDNVTQGLIYEIPVQAVTASATVGTFSYYMAFGSSVPASGVLTSLPGLLIESGYKLRASTQNSESFNIMTTFAGDM